MNVIFLDIDGVINDAYNIRYNRRNGEYQPLDKRMVHMLRLITEIPETKIVISSTWRKLYTGKEFVEIFQDAGWENPQRYLLGTTPSGSGWRGHEIEHWLSTNPVDRFVILDDDVDVLETHADSFMWIDPDIGFTMAHVRSIMDYFQGVVEKLEPVEYTSARTERVKEPERSRCEYYNRMQERYHWD